MTVPNSRAPMTNGDRGDPRVDRPGLSTRRRDRASVRDASRREKTDGDQRTSAGWVRPRASGFHSISVSWQSGQTYSVSFVVTSFVLIRVPQRGQSSIIVSDGCCVAKTIPFPSTRQSPGPGTAPRAPATSGSDGAATSTAGARVSSRPAVDARRTRGRRARDGDDARLTGIYGDPGPHSRPWHRPLPTARRARRRPNVTPVPPRRTGRATRRPACRGSTRASSRRWPPRPPSSPSRSSSAGSRASRPLAGRSSESRAAPIAQSSATSRSAIRRAPMVGARSG